MRFIGLIFAALLFCLSTPGWTQTKTASKKGVIKPLECSEPDPYLKSPKADEAMTVVPEIKLHDIHHYASSRKGFDVSHYQGNINWQAAAADESARFVYVKATENVSLIDDKFQENMRGAREARIPVGIYHFFSPTADALAQLRNLVSAVPDLKGHDLIPVVDVEKIGKGNPSDFCYRLTVFLKGFEDYYHMKPIIYTGTNFYNRYLAGRFNDYKFWIAKYSDGVPELDGNPKFILWQYTAKGHIAGIRGNVDCNCFMDGYNLGDIMIKNANR